MLERLLERASQKKLDDLRQEKENELERQREELVNVNLELRRAQEECKAMAAKLEEARACRVGAEEALMSSTVMTFANPVKVIKPQRRLREFEVNKGYLSVMLKHRIVHITSHVFSYDVHNFDVCCLSKLNKTSRTNITKKFKKSISMHIYF